MVLSHLEVIDLPFAQAVSSEESDDVGPAVVAWLDGCVEVEDFLIG